MKIEMTVLHVVLTRYQRTGQPGEASKTTNAETATVVLVRIP